LRFLTKAYRPLPVLLQEHRTVVLGRTQAGAHGIDLEEVSGAHCELRLDQGGQLTLTDLSTNGTFVDGIRPSKREKRTCEVRHGSSVTLVRKSKEECVERFGAAAPCYIANITLPGAAPARAAAGASAGSSSAAPRSRKAVGAAAPYPAASVSAAAHAAAPHASVGGGDGRGGESGGGKGGGGEGAAASSSEDAEPSRVLSQERLERSLYWSRREELDRRLGELAARLEEHLVGAGAVLLLAPPADERVRAAVERLGEVLLEHVAKLGWWCDEALARATAEAAPWLADEKVRGALACCVKGASGKALPPEVMTSTVALLRKRWKAGGAAAASADGDCGVARVPLVLILDEAIAALPWESIPCLVDQPVCRLPCAAYAARCAAAADTRGGSVSSADAYYLLNPSGDLARTQATFETRFARAPWQGVAGRPPAPEALYAALEQKDLFVYCGHGDGSKYVSAEVLQRLPRCAVAMLMGCSSGSLRRLGGLAPSGMPLGYLHAHSPAVVANLWDVTDGEIDRFSEALVEMCEAGGSLLTAVARARRACRLRYLTGAAAVCYGTPIDFRARASE